MLLALLFFENGVASGVITGNPNDEYRDMLQAYVNEQWDNTTALKDLQEQIEIGSNEYQNVEAMIANLIDLTSTGSKSGQDFIRVFFRDFEHEIIRGRYYKTFDNYWIVDDVSLYEGVAPLMTLRKCNNSLKMIDPASGEIFSVPCVVDYDMLAPAAQISKYVITPNNHANIIVQANVDTMRLFKLNTRFILGGRPFKLLSYQNALLDDLNNQVPTIMYLGLFLDEIHSGDDLEKRIAENGAISIAEQKPIGQDDGIYLIPEFDKIRQYETKQFSLVYKKDGASYDIPNDRANAVIDDSTALKLTKVGNDWELYCKRLKNSPVILSIEIPEFNVTQDFDIRCVNMLGG